MGHEQSQNAMTEIALALAMAFFAILVLAMISMGTQLAAKPVDGPDQKPDIIAAGLKKPSPDTPEQAQTTVADKDLIVVAWQGRFYDATLKPMATETIQRASGRVVLALSPGLSLEEALGIRAGLNHPNLIVSTLSPDWLARLRRMTP